MYSDLFDRPHRAAAYGHLNPADGDDAARLELYDLARRRKQFGGLVPGEERRYQTLLAAFSQDTQGGGS